MPIFRTLSVLIVSISILEIEYKIMYIQKILPGFKSFFDVSIFISIKKVKKFNKDSYKKAG